MSWHYIIDDPTLGAMEKLVLLTVRRHQFGEAAVMLHQTVIAQKAGISLRATQMALSRAVAHGCLEVTHNKNHASLYRVAQKQGLIFSNANFHKSPENSSMAGTERGHRGQGQAPSFSVGERPVENLARASAVHARGAPPGLFETHQVRTFIRQSSGNSKDKNRPEVRRAAPKTVPVYEQKRRIEARDMRLWKEAESRAEARVGQPSASAIGVPMNPVYMEFVRLRDEGRIPPGVSWPHWKALTEEERSALLLSRAVPGFAERGGDL